MVAAAAAILAPAGVHAADGAAHGVGALFRVCAGADDPDDGRRGFDFLHGRWMVAHRNRAPFDDHAPWREFTGVTECRPVVGGLVNVDDNVLNAPTGVTRASTYRVFNPERKQWSIFWVPQRAPVVETPGVQGNFKDGAGVFYSDDSVDGRPFKTRFIWHRITARSARWEQALSTDGGATWVDNWFMDFTRVA